MANDAYRDAVLGPAMSSLATLFRPGAGDSVQEVTLAIVAVAPWSADRPQEHQVGTLKTLLITRVEYPPLRERFRLDRRALML